ncbi:MAG6450 family protein [Nafulsella turpanensis]|uniref:MAG6450 family protein n=1 Tax=Nafulsella turpanensis TaxID=1265690 RepID=UPI000378585E|nr:hypothetical protein [Nafulsella turpanensis]
MAKVKGGNKHLQRSLIPKSSATLKQETTFLNKNFAEMDGWKDDGDKANVFLSTRYIQHKYECFSDWSKSEMKLFWEFQELVSSMTWEQVYQTGRKKQKNGVAYTPIPKKTYPKSKFLNVLSPDITLFELRVSQKSRVHGFRNGPVFYVCWLDKGHKICG